MAREKLISGQRQKVNSCLTSCEESVFIVQCARKIFGLLQNKAVEILHFVIMIKKLLHETREIKKNDLISLIFMPVNS